MSAPRGIARGLNSSGAIVARGLNPLSTIDPSATFRYAGTVAGCLVTGGTETAVIADGGDVFGMFLSTAAEEGTLLASDVVGTLSTGGTEQATLDGGGTTEGDLASGGTAEGTTIGGLN